MGLRASRSCATVARRTGNRMRVLEVAKEANPQVLTKTSIMLGLGESREEVSEGMRREA